MTTVLIEVPDDLHEKLKVRAEQAGMNVSEYVLQEAKRSAELPTEDDLWERLKNLPPVRSTESAVEMIQAGREERESQLDAIFDGTSNRR